MPTPEEIKKLSEQYAEFTDGSPADKAYIRAIVLCFTEWFSKDYCIVPKEHIYMRHGVANALMEQDAVHREFYRGQSSVLESIFGKELFNEEMK